MSKIPSSIVTIRSPTLPILQELVNIYGLTQVETLSVILAAFVVIDENTRDSFIRLGKEIQPQLELGKDLKVGMTIPEFYERVMKGISNDNQT